MAVTMREFKRHPQNQVAALLTAASSPSPLFQPGVLIGAAITARLVALAPDLVRRARRNGRDRRRRSSRSPCRPSSGPGRGDCFLGTEPSKFVPPAWALHNPAPAIALSLLAEALRRTGMGSRRSCSSAGLARGCPAA